MAFSPNNYFKMVEAGEVSITPHFCKCKMCRTGTLEGDFE